MKGAAEDRAKDIGHLIPKSDLPAEELESKSLDWRFGYNLHAYCHGIKPPLEETEGEAKDEAPMATPGFNPNAPHAENPEQLRCPIVALSSAKDELWSVDFVTRWAEVTSASFTHVRLASNPSHFELATLPAVLQLVETEVVYSASAFAKARQP